MSARPYTTRWCIVLFDPNGDMGYGVVLGPFSEERATRLRDGLYRVVEAFNYSLELLLLPTMPVGMADPMTILDHVSKSGTFSK